MEAIYRGWRFLQDRVIGYAAAVTFLVATVFAVTEFIGRYLFGHTFHWGQDAVTYGLVAAAALYFGASLSRRSHLGVTLLPDSLRAYGWPRAALVIRASAMACVIVFVVGFVWWGLPGAERTFRTGRMTDSMVIPLWPFQFALIAGMVMVGISAVFLLYGDVMRLFGRDAFPWESEDEGFEL